MMKIIFKKKYLVLLMFSFIIASSILFIGPGKYDGKTSKVKVGTIQDTVNETGTIYSKRINTFYSDTSQRVKVLNISVGDKVKKGDILLTYENSYDLEIERAKKQIDAITASYNENVKGVDFQEVSNLKLSIRNLENDLNLEKSNFEKTKALFESGEISEEEYKEAENNITLLEGQLQEKKNTYAILLQDVSINVKKQFEAQIDEVMIQIKIFEEKVQQASIKAEFDGIITELNVHQGGMTKPGVPVVEMQDENNLGIYVEVLAEDAIKVVNGMPLIVNINNETKELKINRIYPKAESSISELGEEQKIVRIEADLEAGMNLKIGSEFNVVIVLEEKENILLVDKKAVYVVDNIEYVTVLENNHEIKKEVDTGLRNEGYIEIISGLVEDEVVLIE